MEEIFLNIGNYGFPILVTAYLLLRMKNKIDNLSNSINELSKNIIQSKSYLFIIKKKTQRI